MKAALLLFLSLAVGAASGQPVAAERNVQVFGWSVRSTAPVAGDFSALGGRVVVDHAVAGDALLLGGTVDVRAPVGDDLRAAGGDVSLEGRAQLAGGEVRVDGRVDGSLQVRARRLVLNGLVGGNVQAAVEQLEIGPQARVGGGLRHTASSIKQDPAAVVAGPLERVERLFDDGARWGGGERHPMHEGRWPAMGGWWLLVPLSMGLLGVLALAVVVLFVFPGFAAQAARQIETAPWRALGLGALLLLAVPVLAVLLLFTLLGIPLGLLVMALYPPLLLLGWLIGALFVARWLAARASPANATAAAVPYGWMAVAVVALLVVGAVPVVGQLLIAVTMAAGLGACAIEWRHRLHSAPLSQPEGAM